MDLNKVQRDRVFQEKIPQRVKEAHKTSGSYGYYRDLHNR